MERFRTFHAVASAGGFSAAARRLHRTQPAVSQAVRSLEDELGQRLFDREGRTVRLTYAGKLLYAHVDAALSQLESGLARIEGLKALSEGTLALSVSDTLAIYRLPETLRAYRNRYPGVTLRIADRSSSGAQAQVLSGDADLGILTRKSTDSRLLVEPLSTLRDVAICAPGHALAGAAKVDLGELAGFPLLWFDRSSELRRHLEARLRSGGHKPVATMELGSVEVIKRLVSIDLGVAVVPHMAVTEEQNSRRLHVMELKPRGEARRLWAIHKKRPGLSPAADAMLQLLREHLPANAET